MIVRLLPYDKIVWFCLSTHYVASDGMFFTRAIKHANSAIMFTYTISQHGHIFYLHKTFLAQFLSVST